MLEATIVVLAWIGLAAVTVLAALVLFTAIVWTWQVLLIRLAKGVGVWEFTILLLATLHACTYRKRDDHLAELLKVRFEHLKDKRPGVAAKFAELLLVESQEGATDA